MVSSGVKTVVAVILLMCIAKTSANPCAGRNSGFVNDFIGCRNYYSCFDGFAIPAVCPMGFYFDEVNQKCDLEANVVCNPCPPTGTVFIRKPTSCSNYTICVSGIALERECSAGLWFNTETNGCDLIANVVCVGINNCPSTGVAVVPNVADCTQYLICSNGAIVETRTCASGLFFNRTTLQCVVAATCP